MQCLWSLISNCGRGRLKCDGTRAETRFRISANRTSTFKSAGASVQSTTGSRGVRISGSNAGYTMFRGSVKGTVYPLHSPVSPSLPLPCVSVCHHISTGVYDEWMIVLPLCCRDPSWPVWVVNRIPASRDIIDNIYPHTSLLFAQRNGSDF